MQVSSHSSRSCLNQVPAKSAETINQLITTVLNDSKIVQLVLDYLEELILCVEVGGTRIKAAIFPKNMSLEQLKRIQTVAFSSAPWLNRDLPRLLKKSDENPLFALMQRPYSMIGLSITGPVFENRTYLTLNNYNLPHQLRAACEHEASCDVVIENDVICWAKGALEYLKLKLIKPQFPCLALTFGTGVGIVLIQDENTLCGIELSFIDSPFSRLRPLTVDQPLQWWSAHLVLGKAFFDLIFPGQKFSDEQMTPHLNHYNEKFRAFVADICDYVQATFSVKVSSLLVGGGNSRFMQIPENYTPSTIVLGPEQLKADGVSPDSIQLLGCQSSCQEHYVPSKIHPSHDEMIQRKREGRYQ